MWNKSITLLCVFTVIALCQQEVSTAPNKVVCYFGSWASYRHGNGQFNVEDIDVTKCTHIVYGFTGISADGSVRILDPWNEIDLGSLARFNKLKERNPNLKTLIAIGGWNEGSTGFSQVAASATLRANLAASALQFMQTHGFDGFDFDWEYPGQRGGSWNDKANFVELLKTCREKFGNKYLMTAAVAATGSSADISYDVPGLAKYLDFINIMTYDFHSHLDGATGQNAPLYPAPSETSGHMAELNLVASVNAWLERGAPSEKLVLGLAAYGKTYALANSGNHGLGVPTAGPANQGPYTGEPGTLAYLEICELQKQGGWTTVWDDVQKVPYMYKDNQWVGYDNVQSIKLKVDFAKSMNLGGLMLWSIEMEDAKGICGPKYPILTAINENMFGEGSSTSSPSSTSAPSSSSAPGSTTTAKTTSTTQASEETECTEQGYMRDNVDCSVFYYCFKTGDSFRKSTFKCAGNLLFDTVNNVCDYPENVDC